MSEWKRIITTRKSSFAVGLAWSICSTNYIQQGIEKSQQAVGQISSRALLQSEKPIAKQAVCAISADPTGDNITKNLRYCNE